MRAFVLKHTTLGVRRTHDSGILSSTIVGIEGPNEYLDLVEGNEC
jgi:hypothetical protein